MPAHRDRTVFRAFFLGDELLGEGTPTANLSAVAARVKASFPDALVYANEQTLAFMPGVGSAPCAGSPRCHGVAGASCCFTARQNLSPLCCAMHWESFDVAYVCLGSGTGSLRRGGTGATVRVSL